MSIDNPAPKGQKDSARGFNPGYGKPRGAALKVAEERRDPVLPHLSICLAHRTWRPFRARRAITRYPGLKPRAQSLLPLRGVLTP
jgi:hypothetical protein